jgi:glutamate dehydrogenase (NAD(P)+)
MMEDAFCFADEIDPLKLVHPHRAAVGLKAIFAIDNVACGPAIGGVRMASDVSNEQAFRLARAMTFKNVAAGLPHGGGKSVIFADPRCRCARRSG